MQVITREKLQDWMAAGKPMTIVEVLDPKYFRKFHLPGAINVPLGDDFADEIQKAVPDKSGTVVVYCSDDACQASPKAASKLEELGYQNVYDYEGGKEDWRQAGLPIEQAA